MTGPVLRANAAPVKSEVLDKALASNAPAGVEVIGDVDAMSERAWRP